MTKLNAAGTALIYSTYLGGTGDDDGQSIAVDGSGNAYVTGYTPPPTFPPRPAPIRPVSAAEDSAFVTKLNAAGTGLIYSTYLGGNGKEKAYGIAVDSSATPTSPANLSTNFPITAGAMPDHLRLTAATVTPSWRS